MIRNSILFLFSKIINVFTEFVSTLFFLLVFVKIEFINAIMIAIFICIISIIYHVISWRNNVFYIENDIFYNKRGLFFKKEIKIPLNTIVAVDIEESFKQRIFNLQTLVIDRGMASEIQDIEIVLNKKSTSELRNILLSKQNINGHLDAESSVDDNSNDNIYKISNKDLLIYCLSKKQYVFLISIALSIFFFISELGVDMEGIIRYLIKIDKLMIICIGILVLIKVISVTVNLNKYYNFTFKRNNNILDITHGFTNKKVSSLNLSNIYAIKINQSFLQKILKKVSISVNTLGYGDSPDEESIVFLCVDKCYVDDIIRSLFNDFVFSDEKYNINPKHKLIYKYSRFGYNQDLIYIENNILRTKSTIISTKEIDDICITQNPINKRYSTYNVKLSYKSMKGRDLKKIKGIDLYHTKDIIDLIIKSAV